MAAPRNRSVILAAMFALFAAFGPAWAEDAVEQLNLPPVAAPTQTVSVGAIPQVKSESETADDFADGLMTGLIARDEGGEAALAIVREGHVVAANAYGPSSNARTAATAPINAPLDSLFAIIAALQLSDAGRMAVGQDLSKPLGETSSRGLTLAQAMTRESAPDIALIIRAVEKISGQQFPAYVNAHILMPLGLKASVFEGMRFSTTPGDMSTFLLALTGGDGVMPELLSPASLAALARTQITADPALPGLSFGFTQMRRNGQLALRLDGEGRGVQARLVLVPEAKSAFVIIYRGSLPAAAWQTASDALFDKLLPPAGALRGPAAEPAKPNLAPARAVAGLYEPTRATAPKSLDLSVGDRRLAVRARADGALILSGAENAVLLPQTEAVWQSADGNVTAVFRNHDLLVNAGRYRILAEWKRASFYAWMALGVLILGAVSLHQSRFQKKGISARIEALGFGLAAAALLGVAGLILLLEPLI